MRWADLDILNHVTNVVYLEYAAEARAMLRHDGHLDAERPVADTTVVYLRPTQLSRRPLLLRSTLDGDVLTQEVCTTHDDDPAVHARIVTTHGIAERPGLPDLEDEPLPTRVRATDLGVTGTVSVTGQFRLMQEARIMHFSTRMSRDDLGQFVTGTISLQPLADLTWRPEPHETRSWISRVGRGSFTLNTVLGPLDAPAFVGQTVLVGFDAETQVSRAFGDEERALLETHVLRR